MTAATMLRSTAVSQLTKLPGLAAEWDASKLTGLSNTDPVPTFTAVSGPNLTQATAGFRPTYRTSAFGALPAVRFDGTDDRLEGGSGALISGNDLTLFVVCKLNGTPADARVVCCRVAAAGNDYDQVGGFVLYHPGGTTLNVYRNADLGTTAGSVGTGTVEILAIRFAGALNTLWRNGGTGSTASTDAPWTFDRYLMGSGFAASAYASFASIDHAHHALWGRGLTLPEVNQAGAHLAAKWGGTWTTAT